jgi:ATP-dependent protease ClpP protease subunit
MTLAQKSDRILAHTRGLSGTTPNATQLIEELRWVLEENMKELERLRAERDEARKMYCRAMAENGQESEEREIAEDLDWDCFKEDGK